MEENNQKIKCEVTSCKYNVNGDEDCKLQQITVKPFPENASETPDETVCSNYKHNC